MLVLELCAIDNTSVFLSAEEFVSITYLSFQHSLSITDLDLGKIGQTRGIIAPKCLLIFTGYRLKF